ncbi:MAG: cytochrome b/b6 domain-containing protein, partial [Acidilobaceae archaeon]
MARLWVSAINLIAGGVLWAIAAIVVYYVAVVNLPASLSELREALASPALTSWVWWIPIFKVLLGLGSIIVLLLGIVTSIRYLSLGLFESGKWTSARLKARADELIQRLSPVDVASHMMLAVGFGLAMLTGFILYFADNPYVYGYLYVVSRETLANLHVIGGYLMAFAVVLYITHYLTQFLLSLKDYGVKGAFSRFLILKTLPSLPAQLIDYYTWLFGLKKEHMKYHKYMPTQIVAYFGIGAMVLLIGITGLSMVLWGMQSGNGFAWWVHVYAATLSVALIAFHVFMIHVR